MKGGKICPGEVAGESEVPIPIKVADQNSKHDWALMVRTDEEAFPLEHVMEICPLERIPSNDDGALIKIYNYPCILFNQQSIDHLIPLCELAIFCPQGLGVEKGRFMFHSRLFSGSSGALVTLDNGLAIGMHLEAFTEDGSAHNGAASGGIILPCFPDIFKKVKKGTVSER